MEKAKSLESMREEINHLKGRIGSTEGEHSQTAPLTQTVPEIESEDSPWSTVEDNLEIKSHWKEIERSQITT